MVTRIFWRLRPFSWEHEGTVPDALIEQCPCELAPLTFVMLLIILLFEKWILVSQAAELLCEVAVHQLHRGTLYVQL